LLHMTRDGHPDLQGEPAGFGLGPLEIPRNPEHALLPDCSLPGWMRCVQGFELLCNFADRYQDPAQLRASAETGQAVPISASGQRPMGHGSMSQRFTTSGPITDPWAVLSMQLTTVAGPRGWQDVENVAVLRRGSTPYYHPRWRNLELLEGATTFLAAINWDWEHALARAAFLTYCIAQILDDKRTSQIIQQLAAGQQDLSVRLSKTLVRSPTTFIHSFMIFYSPWGPHRP
jgi:hypothetical protein